MKLYKMTATFGKLSNETLTLQPGLNIIEAPNEWGKSTWCAFLTAMLYGIDTSERSKQGSLADKERYAPWSGEPMSGTIELRWRGRDITIERSAARRVPLGQFRAYETLTGLPVLELTAANCGEMLLGVERSVFTRSAFIRFQDLPVSGDQDLRRRLNALVTTGEETGTAQRLEQQLRELKNRCRHNKTGLLPQFEADRDRLQFALEEKARLQQQVHSVHSQLQDATERANRLRIHQAHLRYQAYLRDAAQLEESKRGLQRLQQEKAELAERCKNLDTPESIREHQQKIRQLLRSRSELIQQGEAISRHAPVLDTPPCFEGKSSEEILSQSREDTLLVNTLLAKRKRQGVWAAVLGIGLPILAFPATFLFTGNLIFALLCLGAAVASFGLSGLILKLAGSRSIQKKLQAIYTRHPNQKPATWLPEAEIFCARLSTFQETCDAANALNLQLTQLQQELDQLTGGRDPEDVLADGEFALQQLRELEQLIRQQQTAEAHLAALEALIKPVPCPEAEDLLSFNEDQTSAMLAQAEADQNQLQLSLGQAQGRAESGQTKQELTDRIAALNRRIARLEDIYAAVSLSQTTLQEANSQLQRRFAPRITQRARELFCRLTGNRYDRVLLDEDFSLSAGAQGENTLRSVLWRSDGTADQLYLALRLAVAAELTPNAPLILDDALIRFDSVRLQKAMEILQEESGTRQILLFTCQGRENSALKS